MKYITFLFLSIFLVSCGQAVKQEPTQSNETDTTTNEKIKTQATEDATNEIAQEVSTPASSTVTDNQELKPVKLQTKYNNPQGEVIMDVNYTLDADNKISSISITSPNYDGLWDFNTSAQTLIGKTVAEAAEADIAGGSLSSGAFEDLLESQLK